MDNSFVFNSFLPEMHDKRWLERRKHYFPNPEEYKKHLREQSDEHWEQAKTGGVSKEMSKREHEARVKEAVRKRKVREANFCRSSAEEKCLAEEKRLAEERRLAEEKRLKELGPNFPKVWDLSYKKEDPQNIFLRRPDDTLDWDFFKFNVYVNETDYFQTNFFEDLDELKWKNTEKVKDIQYK